MTKSIKKTLRLILAPAAISLVITLVRLIGELRHWSDRWFSTETGGVTPSGLTWVIGITWLALPFGVYFALRLVAAGDDPPKVGKALVTAGIGLVVLLMLKLFLFGWLQNIPFPRVLIFVWLW